MSPASTGETREIRAGRIYRDVYDKRADDRRAHGRPTGGQLPLAELEVAHIDDGVLAFESSSARDRALADGVFFMEIPDHLDVTAGDEFAGQFHLGSSAEPYGRFRGLGPDEFGDPLLGFHQRVNQIEQFLLERRFWARHFPTEIAKLGEDLTVLSRRILRGVLHHVGIPSVDWMRATGGCSDAAGSYHLTFNHYRPTLDEIGLNSHKDDGFITVLRTTSPGLEVNRDNAWEAVPADVAHFVVNFGLSMELLTAACDAPVAAIMHRVAQQDADRSSFGHFSSSRCAPGDDDGIYRYLPGTGLQRLCGSRELIDANDHEIYQGTEALSEGDQ